MRQPLAAVPGGGGAAGTTGGNAHRIHAPHDVGPEHGGDHSVGRLGLPVYGKGHPVRKGVVACGLLIIAEALAGAVLVLFGWVADNVSVQRAVSMPLHLVITFALLAALTLTAWFASGGGPVRVRGQGWLAWAWIIALAGTLILGMSGAVTALGDTLFPVKSLAEGLAQDISPTAHFLVRLRMWHPFIAVAVALYAVVLAQILPRRRPGIWVARLAQTQIVLFVVQCVAGALNVALLAPVWMQIVHLLLADLVWINLVLLGAAAFAVSASLPVSETKSSLGGIGRDG